MLNSKRLLPKIRQVKKLRASITIESRSSQTTCTWTANDELILEKEAAENALNLKSWELDRVNDERTGLKKDNTTLKKNIASLTEEEEKLKLTAHNQKVIISQLRKEIKETGAAATKKIKDKGISFDENALVSKEIDKKLENFSTSLLESVTKLVDTKLGALTTLTTIPQEISENCNTFKEVLTRNVPREEIKSVMMESKNDELVQQRERKLRSCNIIIHGVEDQKEEGAESDKKFISEFFGVLGLDYEPKSTTRLGSATNNKGRPLRLTMKRNRRLYCR